MPAYYDKDVRELVRALEEIAESCASGNTTRHMAAQAVREHHQRTAGRTSHSSGQR